MSQPTDTELNRVFANLLKRRNTDEGLGDPCLNTIAKWWHCVEQVLLEKAIGSVESSLADTKKMDSEAPGDTAEERAEVRGLILGFSVAIEILRQMKDVT